MDQEETDLNDITSSPTRAAILCKTSAFIGIVNLPPHDPDLYYWIPGRLLAENFVTVDRAQIRTTVDTDGKFLMKAEGVGIVPLQSL